MAMRFSGSRCRGCPFRWLPIRPSPRRCGCCRRSRCLAGMLRLGAFRASWLAGALAIATFAAVIIGTLQVASGDPGLFALVFLQGHQFRPGDRLLRQQQSHGDAAGRDDSVSGGLVRIAMGQGTSAQVSASKTGDFGGRVARYPAWPGPQRLAGGMGLGRAGRRSQRIAAGSDEAQLGALVVGGRGIARRGLGGVDLQQPDAEQACPRPVPMYRSKSRATIFKTSLAAAADFAPLGRAWEPSPISIRAMKTRRRSERPTSITRTAISSRFCSKPEFPA